MEIAVQQILVRCRESCHQHQMPVRFGLIYMFTFTAVRIGALQGHGVNCLVLGVGKSKLWCRRL